MVIGHEFVGVIEEVGLAVQRFQKGDLVDGEGHIVCGVCRNCLAGRRHLCKDTKGVGVNRPGAFAEYLCIPATNAVPVDPAIPLDVLSCFDPLGNATHTALQVDSHPGRTSSSPGRARSGAWRPRSRSTAGRARWS